MYYWIALVSQHSSLCRSFWANIPLNRSFCFSLAHSCSLWLTHRLTLAPNPALAGSLRGSLWLFMALSGSLWLTLWPLCHSLAHFCSFILLLQSLLGSVATLTHFFPVWVDLKYVLHFVCGLLWTANLFPCNLKFICLPIPDLMPKCWGVGELITIVAITPTKKALDTTILEDIVKWVAFEMSCTYNVSSHVKKRLYQFHKSSNSTHYYIAVPVSLLEWWWDWVKGGDPLYAAVFSLSSCWGLGWSFLTNLFAKLKLYVYEECVEKVLGRFRRVLGLKIARYFHGYVRKVWEKFQLLSRCFRS